MEGGQVGLPQGFISHRRGWVFNYQDSGCPVIGISTQCLGELGDLVVGVWAGVEGACSALNDVVISRFVSTQLIETGAAAVEPASPDLDYRD